MKTLQHTPLPVFLVSALLSFVTVQAGTPGSEMLPTSRTGDAISPNAQEMGTADSGAMGRGQNSNAGNIDLPQGLSAAQERFLQLQTEFATSERTLSLLQKRLNRSVRTVEQLALRKKLAEQEVFHRQLERELRQHELSPGASSQP